MEDVFNLGASEEASSFLNERKSNDDGLLRPKLTEGKDGKRELVIRFLPNFSKKGKLGPTAIEKHIHYADFKQNPELQGYFDCLKNTNIGKDCPLCKSYWTLFNSKNPEDNEKAKLIKRTTKYYAYVTVIEDKQKPENEGKIFIFPFGYKIFQKIKSKAESTRKPVKVEDLVYGANLNLVIQEVAGYVNYDSSEFESPEPITINGEMLEVKKDGSVSAEERQRVMDFLMSREHNLEDFVASDWTEDQYNKADGIISILSGQPSTYSNGRSSSNSTTNTSTPLTSSSVFGDDDEDDDDDAPKAKLAESKKTASKFFDDDEDEEETPKTKLAESKKKSSKFFDDDEDED